MVQKPRSIPGVWVGKGGAMAKGGRGRGEGRPMCKSTDLLYPMVILDYSGVSTTAHTMCSILLYLFSIGISPTVNHSGIL